MMDAELVRKLLTQISDGLDINSLAPGTIVVVNIGSKKNTDEDIDKPCPQDRSASDKEQDSQVEALRKAQYRCKAVRKEFFHYVKNLDQTIFNKACDKFTPGTLFEYNRVLKNPNSQLEAVSAIVDIFKEKINETITEEIIRLKSMMT